MNMMPASPRVFVLAGQRWSAAGDGRGPIWTVDKLTDSPNGAIVHMKGPGHASRQVLRSELVDPQSLWLLVPPLTSTRSVVKPRKPGYDSRGRPTVAVVCEDCGATFYSSRPDMARFCSSRCRDHHYDAPGKPGHRLRLAERQKMRHAPLGRSCQWCQATDREAAFANVHGSLCGPCQRSIHRGFQCGRCKGPIGMHGFCPRCDARCPGHLVEVAWIDAATERERRLFVPRRSEVFVIDQRSSHEHRRRDEKHRRFPVLTDEQKRTALQDGFLALVVPTALWLKRRV